MTTVKVFDVHSKVRGKSVLSSKKKFGNGYLTNIDKLFKEVYFKYMASYPNIVVAS